MGMKEGLKIIFVGILIILIGAILSAAFYADLFWFSVIVGVLTIIGGFSKFIGTT